MLKDEDVTYKIRGCVYEVFRELGAGFLEKVYENALVIELTKQGLDCKVQHPLFVKYKGKVVGEYIVDILVESRIVLELKAVNKLLPAHEAQLLNYMKATNVELGLLINFTHPKAEIKRYVSN